VVVAECFQVGGFQPVGFIDDDEFGVGTVGFDEFGRAFGAQCGFDGPAEPGVQEADLLVDGAGRGGRRRRTRRKRRCCLVLTNSVVGLWGGSGSLALFSGLPPSGRAELGATLARSLATGFLCTADHELRDRVDRGHGGISHKTLDRAVSIIEAGPDNPLDIVALAEACGVSLRTLQYEFARHLGTTISDFRRQIRLDRAHLELRDGDPGATTVAAVAARWGFYHQGRFARLYRARYGAHPSQTLKSWA
jgi:AraC-like DNA-binding protein